MYRAKKRLHLEIMTRCTIDNDDKKVNLERNQGMHNVYNLIYSNPDLLSF